VQVAEAHALRPFQPESTGYCLQWIAGTCTGLDGRVTSQLTSQISLIRKGCYDPLLLSRLDPRVPLQSIIDRTKRVFSSDLSQSF
jgi:hypothetical protein